MSDQPLIFSQYMQILTGKIPEITGYHKPLATIQIIYNQIKLESRGM